MRKRAFNKLKRKLLSDPSFLGAALCNKKNKFTHEQILELCRHVASSIESGLSYVPAPDQEPFLSKKEYGAICVNVLNKNGLALSCVPAKFRTRKMCRIAVRGNAYALGDVVPNKHASLLLRDISNELKNRYQDNSLPSDLGIEYKRLCKAVIKRKPFALKYIPDKYVDNSIYVLAIQKNIKALKYVPENRRNEIIDDLAVAEISTSSYSDLPKKKAKALLSKTKYAVITEDEDLIYESELQDIYLVYANAPHRKGCTVNAGSEDRKALFNKLSKINAEQIHLVLIDHCSKRADELAGLDPEDIAKLLQKYDFINKVILIGCNTAKSMPLEQEEEMIGRLMRHINERRNIKCGLILLSDKPPSESYDKLLKSTHLTEAYIIIKLEKDGMPIYELLYLKRNSKTNEIETQSVFLNMDEIHSLKNLISPTKDLRFPKNPKEKFIFRYAKQPLTENELDKMESLLFKAEKFDKKHPYYQTDKSVYPFLNTMNMNENEISKLKKSFLKKVINAIKNNKKINRPITVKAFTKAFHVDTKNQCFWVTRTHLYNSKYNHSTFFTKRENIDAKKLKQDRNSDIKQIMEKEKNGNKTFVKSIRFTVNGGI